MDNDTFSAVSGGVSGFADAFVQGLQAKQERQAAKERYAAQLELQREMMGLKKVTGLELAQFGEAMGIDPKDLTALKPDVKYDIQLGKEWLDKLASMKNTKVKDTGATKRKEIGAGAKKELSKKTFDPTQAQLNILAGLPGMAGYKKGTPMKSLYKTKEEAIAAANTAQDLARARLVGATRESDFDVQSPFAMTQEPGWFETATYEPQSMFVPRKTVQPAAPAPGLVVTPGAAALAPPPRIGEALNPADAEAKRKKLLESLTKR